MNWYDFKDGWPKLAGRREQKLWVVAVVALIALCATDIAFAADKPSEFQKVNYTFIKEGRYLGVKFHSGIRDEALSQLPFSTLVANIVLPKEVRINKGKLDSCDAITVLNSPNECSKHSFMSEGVGRSWLRPKGNRSVVLNRLTISMGLYNGPRNDVYLRIYSNLSNRLIVPGKIMKGPRGYGQRIKLTLPRGASAPVAGMVSQLSDMQFWVSEKYSKRDMFTLECDRGETVNFGYWAAYNVNQDMLDIGDDYSVPNSHGLIINETGRLIKRPKACP